MPRVQITLNDGSNKIVEVDNGFTDNDIDEIAANLNAQLKPKAQPKPQRVKNTITTPAQTNTPKLETPVQEEANTPLLTGGIEQRANWDSKGRVYYTDENGNKIKPKSDINALQRVGRKLTAAKDNFADFIGNTNPNSQDYKTKEDLTITALTLPFGIGTTATKAIGAKLAPLVGRKIGQNIAQTSGSGLVSGGAYGGIKGLLNENENPAVEALKYGGLGLVGGAAVGGATGAIGKNIAGKNLKKLPTATRADKRTVRTDGKQYYRDYIQDTSIKRNDLGKINFDSVGLGETATQKTKNMVNFPDLKKNIKNAEYIGEEIKEHLDPEIKKIHRLRNGNEDYLIAETQNGKKYYLSKYNENSFQSTPAETGDALKATNNIIPDNTQNLNPNVTKNLEMPETIYNEKTAKQAQKGIQNNINDLIEPEAQLQYVNRRYKNRFYKENVSDPLTQGIHDADVEINGILKEIKNNPDVVNNPEKLAEFEERIANKTGFPDEALNARYYEKYYNALGEAEKYNKVGQDLNLSNAAREAGEIKPSMLARGADNPDEIGAISKELKKQGRLPEYEVLHNAEIKQQADEAIKNNFSNTYAGLLGKAQNKQSELSALDFETARQTISRLYQEGRTAEALELTEQISKKATQAGQAVQALSLWHKTTKEGAVQQAQKIISEYNKTHKKKLPPLSEEQIAKIDELTKNIQKTEPGTRDNLVATQLLMKYQKELVPASFGSKLRTLQNINLLLNAKTFLRNIVGNGIFAGMENVASKPLAAGIDKLIGLRTKQQTRVLPRLNEYLKGMGQGFKEGIEDVGMGINTRDGIGQRFNLNDRRSFTGVPVLEQAEKALNYSLQVPDRAFYQATLNESLANQMRAAGVDKPTAEMIKRATDEALESVYQNNGILGNAVLKTRQAGNEFGNINGYGLGDALIPYAQTPANVVQQGINYSPLGLIKGGVNLAKGNQRQASLDFARALVGSGLMGGGYAAAKNGLINPAIEDYKAKNNYQTLGIRPNTINVGDSNISFNQLQPLSTPLTAGANIADFQQGNAINAIDRTLDSIADLSMLQSYNKFVKDMSEYGKGTAALNLAGSIPSRFTTPTYLKQINTYFDPYLRETYDPNPLIQAGNNIISGIPGLSKNLPLKYDVTGQPIAKYGTEGNKIENALNTFINPVFANQKKDDATMQKLIDLYEQTGDKSVLLPMAAKQISFKDLQGNKVKRKLSGREVSQYQQQLGVVNKQLLDGILNTNLYNMLDDEDKIKLINYTQRYTKNLVDENLFDKPNAQKRNIIRKLTKTKQDEVINKILKTYKNKVLPVKANEIYTENFAE